MFDQPYLNLDGEMAFAHYEQVRSRLPMAQFPAEARDAANLLELAQQYEVFVFDAYGVLNIGNTPIPTSPAVVSALRKLSKSVLVLSNGASYTAAASVEKLTGFGYDFVASEIVSSRMAAERALALADGNMNWGAVAKADFSPDEFSQDMVKLADDDAAYQNADGFLILSTLDWNEARQVRLENALYNKLRPVLVANPDIVSPREKHFGIEPGYLGHRLIEKFGAQVEFHGKPFGSVFDIIDERMGGNILPKQICMIGDTLHTDILGGAARGWHTILVTDHGMFKGLDARQYIRRSGIVPNWIVPTI